MTGAVRVLLVHSPLLTPASWGEVPGRLTELGYAVAVPDLRPALDAGPPFYDRLVQSIVDAAGDGPVGLVGHSRAGPLLPGALARLAARRPAAVFLDARLPHDGRAWLDTLTDDRRAALLGSAEEGRLLPWARWFPSADLATLLPDPAVRRWFQADLPALPVALLREPVPWSDWDRAGAAYVQLSAAYAPVADDAEAAGWPVTRYALDHLAPLTRPREVTDALVAALRAAAAHRSGSG